MDLMRRGSRYLFAVLALVGSAQMASAQWSTPVPVSGNLLADGGMPELAVTDEGFWIVTWDRTAGGAAYFARSETRGLTWTANGEFATPPGAAIQGSPFIAADVTSGTFMAAYQVDFNFDNIPDAATAVTNPDQNKFTQPNVISNFSGYFGMAQPVVASGGNNTWVLAGVETGGPSNDEGIHLWRSINNGQIWVDVASLGKETSTLRFDRNMDLASDGSGNWILVTESRAGSATSPSDIFARFSRSTDNGVAWSSLDEIDGTTPRGQRSRVASAGSGRFVTILQRGTGAGNIMVYRTANSGDLWSDEAVINLAGLDASGNILGQDIAADTEGNVVAVWSAQDPLGPRNRLFYSTSRDGGASWSPADYMTTPTAGADVSDEWPVIQYDGAGRWGAAWQRRSFGTSTTLSIQSSSLVFPIRADLSVSQTSDPDPATVGEPVTFKVTVRNDGPSSASGVQLINTLPADVEVLSVSQTQGTRSETSDTITFNIGDLNDGASATAEIEVLISSPGFYRNVARVTANEEDVDLGDRISTHTARLLVEGVDLSGEWQTIIPDVPRKPYKGRLDLNSKLTIQNFGNKRARAFRILLMYSMDNILSEDDALAGVISEPGLGPGAERIINFSPKVRRYVPWQGRKIIAVIDAEMRVDEVDEFNNTAESEVLPAPELTP